MKNRVCEILNIEKPIVQGPTFWLTSGNYVGAISKAGGLGVLGFNAGQKQSVYTVEETVENMRREVKIVKGIPTSPSASTSVRRTRKPTSSPCPCWT